MCDALLSYIEEPEIGTVYLHKTYCNWISQQPKASFISKNKFSIQCNNLISGVKEVLSEGQLILNQKNSGQIFTFENISSEIYEQLKEALKELYFKIDLFSIPWDVPHRDNQDLESPLKSRFESTQIQFKIMFSDDLYKWILRNKVFEHNGVVLNPDQHEPILQMAISPDQKESFLTLLKKLKDTYVKTRSQDE
jgi:hypothetical protein